MSRSTLALGSALSLLAGVVYYLSYRSFGVSLFENWLGFTWPIAVTTDPSHGTLPSFLHTLALSLLCMALLGNRRRAVLTIMGAMLAMTWLAEPLLGTFDPRDLIAAGLGTLLPMILLRRMRGTENHALQWRHGLAASLVLGLSFAGITGSDTCGDSESGRSCTSSSSPARANIARPVYLSYDDLRSAIRVDAPRELNSVGRVYLYQDLVFLNAPNEGIHVLDNTDPTQPLNRAFIVIPGNTELSIRNGFLHADSYIDLVTIDLSAPFIAPQEVDREQGVFPYDAYQNVPDEIYFNPADLDEDLGVVIGFTEG